MNPTENVLFCKSQFLGEEQKKTFIQRVKIFSQQQPFTGEATYPILILKSNKWQRAKSRSEFQWLATVQSRNVCPALSLDG